MMTLMPARYDAVAATYSASGDNYDGSAIAALLSLVGPSPGPRALDLACGHGPLARELARRGASVTAVDLSAELLRRARSVEIDAPHEIRYIESDAADPTLLLGETFDIIVCNFGLSDIDDLDGVCALVRRVLAPGGRFVFSILHPCFSGATGVSGSWPSGRSYYDEGFWRADGERSVLRRQVGANHRMLSTYFNALTGHGLAIDSVTEPQPESEWASDSPEARDLPVYLVVQCRRT